MYTSYSIQLISIFSYITYDRMLIFFVVSHITYISGLCDSRSAHYSSTHNNATNKYT